MRRPYFGLQNASVDPLTAVELGILVEKNGLDALWVPDHFVDINGDRLDPWTVLAAVAVKTKRITLGAAVTDTQRSHPARTAHQVACLDRISRGRAILGIGAGEAFNVVPFGLPWGSPKERVARMIEAISVIRMLWTSSRDRPVTFSGSFFKLDEAFLSQSPEQTPHPPIYIGAFTSRRALRAVGKISNGWFAWLHTPETFTRAWSVVRDAAQEVGRSPDEIARCIHFLTAFPRNATENRMAVLGAKVALLTEHSVLTSLGYATEIAHYQNLGVLKQDVSKIMREAESVPDEMVHKIVSIGDIDEARRKIDQLAKAGVTHFALQDLLAPTGVKRTLKQFGRMIKDYK